MIRFKGFAASASRVDSTRVPRRIVSSPARWSGNTFDGMLPPRNAVTIKTVECIDTLAMIATRVAEAIVNVSAIQAAITNGYRRAVAKSITDADIGGVDGVVQRVSATRTIQARHRHAFVHIRRAILIGPATTAGAAVRVDDHESVGG